MTTSDKTILRGWKEIEAFLGLQRRQILANGYPIRKEDVRGGKGGGGIFAIRHELLAYAKSRRLIQMP